MMQALLNLLMVLGAVARRDTNNERAQGLADVLSIAEYLIEEGSLTVQKLQQLTNTVKAMAAEERNPTVEELGVLSARSDAAHAAIQDVDLSDDDPTGTFETPVFGDVDDPNVPDGTDEATDPVASDPAETPTGDATDDSGAVPTGSVDDPTDNPNAELP